MGRQCGFQFYWLSTLLGRGGSSLFSASSLAEPAWLWESWGKKKENGVRAVYLLCLVIHPVQRVEVLLDDVPVGAPHLADQDDNRNDDEEKDARQGSKPDDHIQEGVLLTIWKYNCKGRSPKKKTVKKGDIVH